MRGKRCVPLVKYWGTISSQMDVKSQNASSSDINKSKTAAMIFWREKISSRRKYMVLERRLTDC